MKQAKILHNQLSFYIDKYSNNYSYHMPNRTNDETEFLDNYLASKLVLGLK